MNIKRPLVPGFLKRADQKLLLNKPGIWSTRTHLVLYYGLLFMLFLAVLSFLEPRDVRAYSTTEYWIGFVSVIAGIGIIVWLIYLLRFNVFKKYGNIHSLHGLGTFILYFISSGVFVLLPFVHPVVESIRANNAYGDEEIVQDINDINLKIGQLEYPLFKMAWEYDTVAYVKSIKQSEPSGPEFETAYAETAPARKSAIPFYRLDSAGFYNRLNGADSLIKINDTLYLMYNTPSFNFLNTYSADDYTNEKVLLAFELFNKVYRHPPAPAERKKISNELSTLLHKYLYSEEIEDHGNAEMERDKPFENIHNKYRLGIIENSIWHIVLKKYRWNSSGRLSEYVRLFYYFTLGISLLVFVFRHSTVRTFFLSLLTGVLLTILTALMLSFAHFNETSFFACMVIYTFLFFLTSLSTWTNKKRYAVTGIGINLFVFVISFFPLLIVGWCYTSTKRRYYAENKPFDTSGDWNLYFLLAEIGGALLLLVLLATYIGKVYRHWYSLPED